MFKKATKQAARLRLALLGPSGSGKTYTSLLLAGRIAEVRGGRVALLDTEHGSASKYADIFDFDTAELEGDYHPDNYVRAIQAAQAAGYAVIIIDSLTHAWSGPGGVLDLVEQIGKRQKGGNRFAAWADVTPIHNRLIEAILAANIDIIATMRSKTEYIQTNDDRGKTRIEKVGMAPIQRDGVEYEFDVVGDMTIANDLIISKSRCPDLAGKVIVKPGADVADVLLAWLGGASARVDWADRFFADAIALGYESSDAVKARLKELGYNRLQRERVDEMLAALAHPNGAGFEDSGFIEVVS